MSLAYELTININRLQVFHERLMNVKTIAFTLGFILTLSILANVGSVNAQTDSFSFHGLGIVVDFTFPLEAHPSDIITYEVTVTAIVDVALENVTLFVYAPIDSALQQISGPTVSLPLLRAGDSLSKIPVKITLPADTNGTLRCLLYVKTDQSSDYASVTFLTTQVRSVSYGELVAKYGELLANHGKLIAEYENLLDEYCGLLEENSALAANYSELEAEHSELLANHTKLIAEYKNLLDEYNGLLEENSALISSHEDLLNEYNALKANYTSLLNSQSTLQSEYDQLESSYEALLSEHNSLIIAYDSLQENCTSLEKEVDDLKKTISELQSDDDNDRIIMQVLLIAVVGLVALVIYVKRKKQEPYLVIRKEDVSLNKEKQE